MRMLRSSGAAIAAIVLSVIFSSCTSGTTGLSCDSVQSVSGYVQRFSIGLDNFSENQYQQLRLDTLDVLDIVNIAAGDSAAPENANSLSRKLNRFIVIMDDLTWDVSRAIQNVEAIEAADDLGNEATLREANDVESYVIRKCGLPSTVPIGANEQNQLPDPSIPSPTATDPTTNTINETSEVEALGTTVANIFP